MLGIAGGKTFTPGDLALDILQAVKDGMADAWAEFGAFKIREIDTLKVTSGDVFGTRAFLKNNYLYRMAGAILGIYGNSKEEAMYPVYLVDGAGAKLDGSTKAYALRFAPGQLPPVNSFWSLTLYELPSSLLYANPLKRYLINSPMLPDLTRDADGGLTLHVQNASPGQEREFELAARPERAVLDGVASLLAEGRGAERRLEAAAAGANGPSRGGFEMIKVTPESYIRAESDRSFMNIETAAGGVNRFFHIRRPTPLDAQTDHSDEQGHALFRGGRRYREGRDDHPAESPGEALHLGAGRRQRPLLPGRILRAGRAPDPKRHQIRARDRAHPALQPQRCCGGR